MSKIRYTLVLLMCFFVLTASARRHSTRSMSYDGMLRTGFHIGVQGSINSTWILNQNNYNTLDLFKIPIVRQSEMDYEFTWGGQIGVEVGYNFHKNWGLEFHPSFSWAGQFYDDAFVGPVAAISVTDPVTHVSTFQPDQSIPNADLYFAKDFRYVHVRREIKFNYMQFPLYAKYVTHIGDLANYYVMLGPQLNVRQSASETVWVHDAIWDDPANRFSPDQKFQKIDIGLGINTGVEIYAKEWVYFTIGLTSFIAFNDLNGASLKGLEWYSKNDVDYQKSRNFYMGINGGVHFYFSSKHFY